MQWEGDGEKIEELATKIGLVGDNKECDQPLRVEWFDKFSASFRFIVESFFYFKFGRPDLKSTQNQSKFILFFISSRI